MELISSRSELLGNIAQLREYLRRPGLDRDFASDLVRKGRCFVIAENSGEMCFAPSRFVGYRTNNRHDHLHNGTKHGSKTNDAIMAILAAQPLASAVLEEEYVKYCITLGISPCRLRRKYWDLRLDAA